MKKLMKSQKLKATPRRRLSKKRQKQRVDQLARKSILPMVGTTVAIVLLIYLAYRFEVFEGKHSHGDHPATIQASPSDKTVPPQSRP
jgi:hypothetical protein